MVSVCSGFASVSVQFWVVENYMCPVGSGSPFSYTVVSVQLVKSRDHEMSSLYLAMTSSHGRLAGIERGATNPVPRIRWCVNEVAGFVSV